ncbi:MAG: hypothetical protein IJJ26_12210 [Victivallales bacterium]|jgi:hypothetical protein|nr:hypothetical protein [Victivallales bacterium]
METLDPQQPHLQMLEIERELTGEHAQEALEKYDAILLDLDARLKRAMNQGLPPSIFPKCQALSEVCPTARKILRIAMKP